MTRMHVSTVNQSMNKFLGWHKQQTATTRTTQGEEVKKRCSLNRFRKVNREGAEVTSAGRAFQTRAPATEKARRPTVFAGNMHHAQS